MHLILVGVEGHPATKILLQYLVVELNLVKCRQRFDVYLGQTSDPSLAWKKARYVFKMKKDDDDDAEPDSRSATNYKHLRIAYSRLIGSSHWQVNGLLEAAICGTPLYGFEPALRHVALQHVV